MLVKIWVFFIDMIFFDIYFLRVNSWFVICGEYIVYCWSICMNMYVWIIMFE